MGMDLSVPAPMPRRKRDTTVPTFMLHIFETVYQVGDASDEETAAYHQGPSTTYGKSQPNGT